MSLFLPGTQANVLQEAHVPIISDTVCNGPDYYDNQVTTTMFCAGYEKGGTDSCQVHYPPVYDIISFRGHTTSGVSTLSGPPVQFIASVFQGGCIFPLCRNRQWWRKY